MRHDLTRNASDFTAQERGSRSIAQSRPQRSGVRSQPSQQPRLRAGCTGGPLRAREPRQQDPMTSELQVVPAHLRFQRATREPPARFSRASVGTRSQRLSQGFGLAVTAGAGLRTVRGRRVVADSDSIALGVPCVRGESCSRFEDSAQRHEPRFHRIPLADRHRKGYEEPSRTDSSHRASFGFGSLDHQHGSPEIEPHRPECPVDVVVSGPFVEFERTSIKVRQ